MRNLLKMEVRELLPLLLLGALMTYLGLELQSKQLLPQVEEWEACLIWIWEEVTLTHLLLPQDGTNGEEVLQQQKTSQFQTTKTVSLTLNQAKTEGQELQSKEDLGELLTLIISNCNS